MRLKTVRENSFTVLFDQDLFPDFPEDLFDPAGPRSQGTTEHPGRSPAMGFVHAGVPLIRKRYERGGCVRHLIRDSYAYLGLQRTRMWREFHLLVRLGELGLPVPVPVAVRCERNSFVSYRGELVTRCLTAARTLVEVLEETPLSAATWASVGRVMATFHREDVFHADLNARNIMLDRAGGIFLIDFDKGVIRPRLKRRWAAASLERLARSLRKAKRLSGRIHFSEENLRSLREGYRAEVR